MVNEGLPNASPESIDALSRGIHLALAVCGVAALASGQFADDYKSVAHPGYSVHRWLGMCMVAALGARVLCGLVGPRMLRFSAWVPATRARLALAGQDLVTLLQFRIPVRAMHEGLAGLVQAIGLAAFAWMAVTGVILFAWLEPGARATGWMRVVKELHEGGQVVVYGFIALHFGAVVFHALTGDDAWRAMFFLKRRDPRQP